MASSDFWLWAVVLWLLTTTSSSRLCSLIHIAERRRQPTPLLLMTSSLTRTLLSATRPLASPAARAASSFNTAPFEPRNAAWREDVEASFAKQSFMRHLGARLIHVEPGKVDIVLSAAPTLHQQHGHFHAGVTTSIADSAGGYAAMTLMEPGAGVLTTELKINLLNPAQGDQLVASGRVVKSGKTLTVCRADVYGLTNGADGEQGGGGATHVATMLLTTMQMPGAG